MDKTSKRNVRCTLYSVQKWKVYIVNGKIGSFYLINIKIISSLKMIFYLDLPNSALVGVKLAPLSSTTCSRDSWERIRILLR